MPPKNKTEKGTLTQLRRKLTKQTKKVKEVQTVNLLFKNEEDVEIMNLLRELENPTKMLNVFGETEQIKPHTWLSKKLEQYAPEKHSEFFKEVLPLYLNKELTILLLKNYLNRAIIDPTLNIEEYFKEFMNLAVVRNYIKTFTKNPYLKVDEEDEKVKRFLETILNLNVNNELDPSDLIHMIENFMGEADAPDSRYEMMNKLLSFNKPLIMYLIKKFLKEYEVQEYSNLNKYFNEVFIKDPYVVGQFRKYNIIFEGIPEVRVLEKKKLKPINYENQILSNIETECMNLYYNPPWINEKVVKIYITSDESDITPYIHKNNLNTGKEEFIELNGKKWYKVNKKYYTLQCNLFSKGRQQNGYVLTLYDEKGQKVSLSICYLTDNDNYIFQDEEIFKREKEYLHKIRLTVADKIELIKQEVVGDDVIKYGETILKRELERATGQDFDKEFISSTINAIESNSKNVEEFVEKLGELIIYLSLDPYNITSRIFIKRLNAYYYTPEVLALLPPEEKLPEYFQNWYASKKDKDNISRLLNNNLSAFSNYFLTYLYVYRNPFDHVNLAILKPLEPFSANFLDKVFTDKEFNSICENKNDIINTPSEDLILYEENMKVYCLNIIDLWLRFKEGNFSNPYTGQPLTLKFIENFNKTYNINAKTVNTIKKSFLIKQQEYEVEKEIEKKNIDTRLLLKIILKDIEEIEKSYNQDSHSVRDYFNTEDSVSVSSNSSNSSNSSIGSVNIISDTNVNNIEDVENSSQYLSDSEHNSSDNESTTTEEDKEEMEQNIEEDKEEDDEVLQKIEEDVKVEDFKNEEDIIKVEDLKTETKENDILVDSIFEDANEQKEIEPEVNIEDTKEIIRVTCFDCKEMFDESKMLSSYTIDGKINFCSFKCFEKFEKWPKIKKIKKKLNKI